MAFYSSASNASLWRGVNYYKDGNVRSFRYMDEDTVEGVVAGSEENVYDVRIDVSHPKKSTCTCPFAEGRRVVCKHMVALYFTSVEGSYERFEEDMQRLEVQYELEEQRWREETLERIKKQVSAMSAKQAKEKLVDILYQNELDYRYRDDYGYW